MNVKKHQEETTFLTWIAAAVLVLTLLLLPSVASAASLAQGFDITEQCFAVADERVTPNGGADSQDTLTRLNRTNGQSFVIGLSGTSNIEAIAMAPGDILYAANGGQLGTLDFTTGLFTAKSQQMGTATGSAGAVTLGDPDGLFFDIVAEKLFAAHRRSGNDLLFMIDPVTGAHVPNAFGVGKGYVEAAAVTDASGAMLHDLDDIAVDPETGTMYGAMNRGGAGGVLVIVDKTSGATTKIGEFRYPTPYPTNPALAGQVVDDIEGLSFFNDGQLYGSTGDNGPDANDKNQLFQIDKTAGLATRVGAFPVGRMDFEGLACLTANSFIQLTKYTNGPGQPLADADTPTGPNIAAGDPVTWTYTFTNTGVLTLTDIILQDDQIGTLPCPPAALLLGPGQSFTCTANGTAQLGQYVNLALITATTQVGLVTPRRTVTDKNPSHYFGFGPGIEIKKFTNGADADDPNGLDLPQLAPGAPITWTYLVTNTGNISLTAASIVVTDSQPSITPVLDPASDVGADSLLAPGEVWTYVATGSAANLALPPAGITIVPGCDPTETGTTRPTYENIGAVTVGTLQDSDPSHYCNPDAPGIVIKKFTNGFDADTPTGPTIPVGAPVTWTYIVTNTGNVRLTNVTVSDDKVGAITCPKNVLLPQESMTCTATGVATAGQYANLGSVTGTPPSGSVVRDDDSSHYLGSITLSAIGDFVWNDGAAVSANGIQDPDELGVPGVTVKLFSADGTLLATKVTDAKGNYLFSGLNPGNYFLEFTPLGHPFSTFTRKGLGSDDQKNSDVDPITKRTAIIALPAGVIDTNWDAGFLTAPTALEPGEEPTEQNVKVFLPLARK